MPQSQYMLHKEKEFICLILNSSPLHDVCFVKIVDPKNSGYSAGETELIKKSDLEKFPDFLVTPRYAIDKEGLIKCIIKEESPWPDYYFVVIIDSATKEFQKGATGLIKKSDIIEVEANDFKTRKLSKLSGNSGYPCRTE